jgi:hypothetical protein
VIEAKKPLPRKLKAFREVPPLVPTRIRIIIRFPSGQALYLDAREHYTISQVETMIRDKMVVPPSRRRLYHAGIMLTSTRTLGSYNIQDGEVIYVIFMPEFGGRGGIVMHISDQGKKGSIFSICVRRKSTIMEVKTETRLLSGVPPEEQRLMFDGIELEDGRFVTDYGIEDEGFILLFIEEAGR